MKLKLISCEVFYREMCWAISQSPHQVDLEFLPKGLHDLPCKEMQDRMQGFLDRVDQEEYDAIILGYGLCNNGLNGLRAREIPLVLPRAHDCITLFLGSRARYMDYFNNNPGVYFKTSGWIERGEVDGELKQHSIQHLNGLDMPYEELVEKYGEDNAQYIFETLGDTKNNYHQFTFIEMGIEPDDRFEKQTLSEARERGWKYEKLRGDMTLIQKLVNGKWDEEEFLVVQPGQRVVAKYHALIVEAG